MKSENFTSLFLVLIFCLWFKPTTQFLTRGRFFKKAKFVVDILHQLSSSPFQVYNVSEAFYCTLKCIDHDQCLSFNMAVKFFGRLKLCQLHSNDKYSSPEAFRESRDFNLYSIDIGLARHQHTKTCQKGGTWKRFYWTGTNKCLCLPGFSGTYCESSTWVQLNSKPVHIEPKDNKFGVFHALHSTQILKFKLVYISGGMSCWLSDRPITNFGCGPYLHIIITNTTNQIISPDPSSVDIYGSYNLPGVTSNDQELVFADISPPLQVNAGQEFRVWYGEDLIDLVESDNLGTLDIDVYAYYN